MGKSTILVALRDVESVESLVTLACQISGSMEAELAALHVVEVPMATPIEADDEVLDRPGHAILERARKVAAQQFSRPIATKLLRARRAGEAIVDELREQGVESLIMGYHRPHTLGEILLGSTVQYVVRHTPCRVIVQIPPVHPR